MSATPSGLARPLVETLGYIFHRGRLKQKTTDLRKLKLPKAEFDNKNSLASKNVNASALFRTRLVVGLLVLATAPMDYDRILRMIQFQA